MSDQIQATAKSDVGIRPDVREGSVQLCVAVDGLITWYDDFAFGHQPTNARLRLVVANLYRAGPHPDPLAAGDISLLVGHGPRHLETRALLAIERLRLGNHISTMPLLASKQEPGELL